MIYTREEAHAVVRRMMMSLDDKYSMWLPADEYRKATSKPTEGMRPRRQFSWVGRIPPNCDRVRLLVYRNHAMESPACVAWGPALPGAGEQRQRTSAHALEECEEGSC